MLVELEPGWNAIAPGGDTLCAEGTPFRFFVRPGSKNRVVIEFRGGGACWDERTCSRESSLFERRAEAEPWMRGEGRPAGIHDHDDAKNPFAEWHHVFVPYCTGDIHWGNNVVSYGGSGRSKALTIHHKGAVNARAVLDWVFERVPAPEAVFVAGCSAGAYGAIMWAPHVRRHYGEATRVIELGDSGVGVITPEFLQVAYRVWKPQGSFPGWIAGVEPSSLLDLASLYIAVGRWYPDISLLQASSEGDEEQRFRYRLMGGDPASWPMRMKASLAHIEAAVPNFASFVAPGDFHCFIPSKRFYTVDVDGTRFVDWLRDRIE